MTSLAVVAIDDPAMRFPAYKPCFYRSALLIILDQDRCKTMIVLDIISDRVHVSGNLTLKPWRGTVGQ